MARKLLVVLLPVLLCLTGIIGILLLCVPTTDIREAPGFKYGIVLDAGSSHTALFIYKWPADKENDTGIVSQHSMCDVKGPGISSYADSPLDAGNSLKDCLDQAVKAVPMERHPVTPIYLGATAGMRLLNLSNHASSNHVLDAVSSTLQSYPFDFRGAKILSGQDEGVFGWVTANYLLENFIKYGWIGRWIHPRKGTLGAMDLGGASTQITFETKAAIENPENEVNLRLYGQTYKVYTHSFLCYGRDQVLRRLMSKVIKAQNYLQTASNPCWPQGYFKQLTMKEVYDSPCTADEKPSGYNPDATIDVSGTGDHNSCRTHVNSLFQFSSCHFSTCSFDGVFQPSVSGNFIAFAAFFYTVDFIRTFMKMPVTSPADLQAAAVAICSLNWSQLVTKAPGLEKRLPDYCTVANFVYLLTIQGYKFDEQTFSNIAFQKKTENGVLLPSLQSALPFLDLHSIPRLEFHQTVFDELREKLLDRVSVIASEGKDEDRYSKLEELLEKCFSLVKMPSIQPVVMCVMKHLPKVPEKKLKLVMADKELYKACAVEVKRQIWQDNQALYGDEVSPLLKQYILEKENLLFSSDLSVLHNFFSLSPKSRRQGEVVQKLTQMIGKNVKLYDMVLQFLRTLFLRTRNVHYCTLRAELLMSLHDLDISEICSVDPCHKFTWCLDACIREKFVDNKRARELQGFLDGVKKGQEQMLGDLSMILCDPFAINTLALSTIRNLQELVGQEALPRDSPDLLLLLRMLSLGHGAWDMIDSQIFREPKMEPELISRFLPMLQSFVVDDYTFNVDQKLPTEEKSSVTYPSLIPDAFTGFLQENRVACEVCLYYVLHITKQRNRNALLRLLPALVETLNDAAFTDIFLHLFTSNLTLVAEEFGTEEFCTSLFDGFFFSSMARKENVHRHTLRLLLHLHHKVAPSKLESLQKALEPTKTSSDALKDLYNQLTEKQQQRKPSPAAQAPETPTMDLTMHTVPAPAVI